MALKYPWENATNLSFCCHDKCFEGTGARFLHGLLMNHRKTNSQKRLHPERLHPLDTLRHADDESAIVSRSGTIGGSFWVYHTWPRHLWLDIWKSRL